MVLTGGTVWSHLQCTLGASLWVFLVVQAPVVVVCGVGLVGPASGVERDVLLRRACIVHVSSRKSCGDEQLVANRRRASVLTLAAGLLLHLRKECTKRLNGALALSLWWRTLRDCQRLESAVSLCSGWDFTDTSGGTKIQAGSTNDGSAAEPEGLHGALCEATCEESSINTSRNQRNARRNLVRIVHEEAK